MQCDDVSMYFLSQSAQSAQSAQSPEESLLQIDDKKHDEKYVEKDEKNIFEIDTEKYRKIRRFIPLMKNIMEKVEVLCENYVNISFSGNIIKGNYSTKGQKILRAHAFVERTRYTNEMFQNMRKIRTNFGWNIIFDICPDKSYNAVNFIRSDHDISQVKEILITIDGQIVHKVQRKTEFLTTEPIFLDRDVKIIFKYLTKKEPLYPELLANGWTFNPLFTKYIKKIPIVVSDVYNIVYQYGSTELKNIDDILNDAIFIENISNYIVTSYFVTHEINNYYVFPKINGRYISDIICGGPYTIYVDEKSSLVCEFLTFSDVEYKLETTSQKISYKINIINPTYELSIKNKTLVLCDFIVKNIYTQFQQVCFLRK